MLPAGESKFLGGVKSMVVDAFRPEENLSHRLLRRQVPLFDQKVLVITGKSKVKDVKVQIQIYSTNISVIIISFFMHWDRGKFFVVLH